MGAGNHRRAFLNSVCRISTMQETDSKNSQPAVFQLLEKHQALLKKIRAEGKYAEWQHFQAKEAPDAFAGRVPAEKFEAYQAQTGIRIPDEIRNYYQEIGNAKLDPLPEAIDALLSDGETPKLEAQLSQEFGEAILRAVEILEAAEYQKLENEANKLVPRPSFFSPHQQELVHIYLEYGHQFFDLDSSEFKIAFLQQIFEQYGTPKSWVRISLNLWANSSGVGGILLSPPYTGNCAFREHDHGRTFKVAGKVYEMFGDSGESYQKHLLLSKLHSLRQAWEILNRFGSNQNLRT